MALTDLLAPLQAVPNFFLGGGLQGAVAPSSPSTLTSILGIGPQLPGLYASVGTDPATNLPTLTPTLPQYITSAQNKYADPTVQQFLATLSPQVRESLISFDTQRISQGSPPLTREQMVQAGLAANNRQIPTEGRDRHWWNIPGNTVSDLRTIVSGLPRMFDPRTWIHEALSLGDFAGSIERARAQGANPIQALTQAPGIRLIPGAYTVGNLTNPRELATHPLFTLLDVLPVANEAAKGTRVFAEAERLRELANTRAGEFWNAAQEARAVDPEDVLGRVRAAETQARILGRQAQELKPIRAVLGNTLDESGNLVPSRAGEYVNRFMRDTAVGKSLEGAFGFHPAWQKASQLEQRMLAIRDAKLSPANVDEQLVADVGELSRYAESTYGMDAAARQDLYRRQQSVNLNPDHPDYTSFTPAELDILGRQRELLRRFAESSRGNLAQVAGIADEWFPKEQADTLNALKERAVVTRRAARWSEEARIPSGSLTREDFIAGLDEIGNVADRTLAKHELMVLGNAMAAYGYPVGRGSAFAKAMREAIRNTHATFAGPAGVLQDILANTDPATLVRPATIPELLAVLDRYWRYDKSGNLAGNRQAYALREAIVREDNVSMTKYLNNLRAQTQHALPFMDDPAFTESIRNLRDRIHDRNRFGRNYTLAAADRAETAFSRRLAATPPARFDTIIRDKALARVREFALGRGATPEQVQQLADHITSTNWQAADQLMDWEPDATRKLFATLTTDIGATWQELKAEGYDPVFTHRVTRSRAANVISPRLQPVPVTETQFLERLNDWSPEVEDWAVSLSHMGVERLQRRASEDFFHFIAERYGVRQADLQDQFLRYATPDSPLNVHQQMRDIIGARYKRWDPDAAGYSWGGTALDMYRQEQVFIPAALADALQKLNKPKSQFLTTMDKATKMFRLSVVALSPRAQLYNMLGGAVQVAGEGGAEIFKYWDQAARMRKDPTLIPNEFVRADMGATMREFLDTDLGRAQAATSYLFGKTVRRMQDQYLTRAGEALNRAGEFSLRLNGMMDDQYRVMAYLYGYDKAITRGLSEPAARIAGEELLRKTMMDWMGASPVERDVIKSIVPFYGFMRHALRYVMRYPFDHPLRAAVIGAFGRAEEHDAGGLPLNLLAMVPMPFTSTSADGTRMHLSLGALNPFADVANMFTLAGWLAATNPVINTVLESVGVDSTGQAELYPTLHFDPETGRVAATHPNLLMSFAQNTIPQSQVLFSALGVNADFNERAQRDPAGALRSLVSSLGLPPVPRPISLPQEYFKTELARQKSIGQVQTEALRSGDWSRAQGYGSLHPLLAQVQQLTNPAVTPPETLQQFLAMSPEQVRALMFSPAPFPGKSLVTADTGGS